MKSSHRFFLYIIFIALTLQLTFIAVSILPWAQVLWDEAEFLLWIQRVTLAIQSHNFSLVTQILWDQTHYPPFQSLLYGALLAPFGFSVMGARIISLGLSVISAYLTFTLGIKVASFVGIQKRWISWVGLIGSLLFISSPILIYLQSIALKEALFIPIILCICLTYIDARKNGKFSTYASSGLWLSLLFFTKYEPFGFVAIALGIEAIIGFFTEKKKLNIITGHVYLFAIPILLAMWWIYGSAEHTRVFFLHINNTFDTTGGRDILTNILFYPRALFYSFGMTYSVGILLLVSWILSLWHLKKMPMRFLWILFTTNFVLLAPRFINLQDRYLAITIPTLFVLSAMHIITMMHHIDRREKVIRIISTIIVLLLASELMLRISIFDRWMYGIGTKAMFTYAFNQPDANIEWFNYDPSSWSKRHPSEARETMQDLTSFITANINPHTPFVVRGRLAELAPPYVHMVIESEKARRPPAPSPYALYHITFTVIPGSRYYTYEYRKLHEWVQWEVNETKNDPNLVRVAERTFPEFGIRVGIYGKP